MTRQNHHIAKDCIQNREIEESIYQPEWPSGPPLSRGLTRPAPEPQACLLDPGRDGAPMTWLGLEI